MDNDLILNLREALKFSPNNVPLRLTLADALFVNKSFLEAEVEYKLVLENVADNVPAKAGLAKVFFEQQKYSAVIIIVEELIEDKPNDVNLLMLISKSLLRNGEKAKAIDYYQRAMVLNPSLTDAELDQHSTSPHFL